MNAGERIQNWSRDGKAVLVISAKPREGRIFRLETDTGKRTLLQTIQPHDVAGAIRPMTAVYAEQSRAYAYTTTRILGSLYIAEGLE